MEKEFKIDRINMLNPILEILNGIDHELSVNEIDKLLIKKLEIPHDEVAILHNLKQNRTELNYRSAWAKTYLKKIGYINNENRGYWKSTDMGRQIDSIDLNHINETIHGKKEILAKEFLLLSLSIKNKGKKILDVQFTNKNDVDKDYYTLLIGENTLGKSFILGQITDIFVYLEKYKQIITARNLIYDSYVMEYKVNDSIYMIALNFNSQQNRPSLVIRRDSIEIPFEKLLLPSKIIAISYNLNDSFNYSPKNTPDFYYYQGIRKFRNTEFVFTIWERIYCLLISKKREKLDYILSMLKYKEYIKVKVKNTDIEEVFCINSTIKKYKLQELSNAIKNESEIAILFEKNDSYDEEMINIEKLSSGEKQLLFTFFNICTEILPGSLVLIDEPENNLHPSWQSEYLLHVRSLIESLEYKSHLLFATHSPFLVSGLSELNSAIVVAKKIGRIREYKILDYSPFAWSIENILYSVFGMSIARNVWIDSDMQTIIKYFSRTEEIKEIDLISSFNRLNNINNLPDEDALNLFRKNALSLLKEKNPNIVKKLETKDIEF